MSAVTLIKDYQADFRHIEKRYDAEDEVTWCIMRQQGRPCFSRELLDELATFQRYLRVNANPDADNRPEPTRFMVFCSDIDEVYSLGGDLELFSRLIRGQDREALRDYARLSIQVLYQNAVAYNLPLTTIALIEGDAIGAGLESALSCDVVIAERGTRMGFPEALFGLFPGMGAHSFISRRIELARLEKMILSGRLYSAEEMFEIGLVDELVDPGQGREATRRFVRTQSRKQLLLKALRDARLKLNPLDYEELEGIVDIWVDTAMQLGDRELRVMDRLVRAQQKRFCQDV